MIESKRDRFIRLYKDIVTCPICGEVLRIHSGALRCINNHTFDISGKGYVNLVGKTDSKLYPRELFEARRRIFNLGIYDPLIDIVEVDPCNIILDVGCGEGSFLSRFENDTRFGIDISKDAVAMATDFQGVWLMANLASLPFAPSSFDAIFNVLTPANYEEFRRILKPGGKLIKVIPGKDYLKEIRKALKLKEHSSESIHLIEHNAKVVKRKKIRYSMPVTPVIWSDLIAMTPMSHDKSINAEPFPHITIDLEVFTCYIPQ